MRRATRIVFVLALALLGTSASAKEVGLVKGTRAPTFSMKTANPEKSGLTMFSLKKLVGPKAEAKKKAVLLTFAASYCEPCKRELVRLKELAPALKKAEVSVVPVIIDREEAGQKKMLALAEKLELPFPVLVDRFGILARRYRLESLPYLVHVGSDGEIKSVHIGYEEAVLQKLLVELGVESKPTPSEP